MQFSCSCEILGNVSNVFVVSVFLFWVCVLILKIIIAFRQTDDLGTGKNCIYIKCY